MAKSRPASGGAPGPARSSVSNVEELVASGLAHFRDGRYEAAEKALRAAAHVAPLADSPYNVLGIVLRHAGKLAEACASFECALERNPANVEARNNLGNVLLERGEIDRAEACYRAALALKPDFVQARMNLGAMLRRRG